MKRTSARARALGVVAVIGVALLLPAVPARAIIGGTPTEVSAHPYCVRVFTDGSPCGGSMIDRGVILTAAHCVDSVDGDVSRIEVLAAFEYGFRTATSVQIHPLWNGSSSDGHDLAIVRVSPVGLAGVPVVRVGAPADPGAYAAGTPATAIGQGRTSPSSGAHPPTPHALDTILRSDDDMEDFYDPWYGPDNWPQWFAIGAGTIDHTICEGDSGGPLTVIRNNARIQVGVASFVDTWPDHCHKPGGFAELAGPQLAWVASKVPTIPTSWGSCFTSSGSPGRWYAIYQSAFSAGAARDGQFYWNVWCGGLGVTTTTVPGATTTTTVPGPPPPADTVCLHKPWTPGCF